MKTLQNNFTTPEQSKKLLEMGIPADSADYFYTPMHEIFHDSNRPHVRTRGYEVASSFFGVRHDYIPCWSVGRLIEIALICSVYEVCPIEFWRNDTPMDDIMYEIEYEKMDFSKLEEYTRHQNN
jgi:hypothetical protein